MNRSRFSSIWNTGRPIVLGMALAVAGWMAACSVPTTPGDNSNGPESPNPTPTEQVEVSVEGMGGVEQSADGGMVTLTASPMDGWLFQGWSGSLMSGDNPLTVQVEEGTTLTATFIEEDNGPNLDLDGDGVPNQFDECADTPAGQIVNTLGCSSSQTDDDDDGVVNAEDDCPGTRAGIAVNSDGCPSDVPPIDTDGDGVFDGQDQCPNTPPGTTVDADGCGLANDEDNDGVADVSDLCPGTAAGVTVDETGCEVVIPDSDGDGIPDSDDTCPNTPLSENANNVGCGPSQRDLDGDGVNDADDACPGTRPNTAVEANGCPADVDPPPPPPDPPEDGLTNDSCSSPIAIGDGQTSFTTETATTDGFVDPGQCVNIDLSADVWFCYTATCSQFTTVNLCSTTYDSTLAVYQGCDCPSESDEAIICDDDFCGASAGSQVRFEVAAGESYLIRVGGFEGETGTGTLDISCGEVPDPAEVCGEAGSGSCFEGNGSPGCDDFDCCEGVCLIDTFCCEQEWDNLCADVAEDACTGTFSACGGPGSGDCSEANGTPGCEDEDCCRSKCELDFFCCEVAWDEACVDLPSFFCQ